MFISDAAAQAARQRLIRPAAFLRIEAVPVARAWSGVGPFTLPPGAFDPAGGRYKGVGWLQNIPELAGLLQGEAEQVTFTLSGVDAQTIELVDAAAESVEGRPAYLGFMFLNRRQQPIDGIYFARTFTVATIGWTDEPAGSDPTQIVARNRSVSITMDTALSSRRRGQLMYWTPEAQARVSPTDKAFRHVPAMNAGVTRTFPPK